jgi:sugar phosphate isomerase/epimerase
MKIGLSTCGFTPDEEAFRKLAEAGIDAVELSMEKGYMDALDFAAVRRYADTYGVELWSCHLPFYPFEIIDLSSEDASLRERTLAYYEGLIAKGTAVGITRFVVHPSGEPISDETRANRLSGAKDSLAKLAELAETYGATIAVEDLPRSCLANTADELAELISASDKLRVCFDVNHLLQGTHADFLEKLGDKIITLHISDYDFKDEKHWLPGEGTIDWSALMDVLDEIGYAGPFLYELGYDKPAHTTRPHLFSIERSRMLTPEDFVNNHRELEERAELTVIGTRVYDEN